MTSTSTLHVPLRRAKIPFWLKLLYTLFLCVLVPYYWVTYGPVNFLWFCDVALLATLAALWLENSFLASMQLIAIGLPQMLWVADFAARLVAGVSIIGLADYMFDEKIPLFVRGLSSFHGWLPFLLLWMVWRLGYSRRAWLAQIVAAWVLLPVCYLFTSPPPAPADNPNAAVNINWVYGLGEDKAQQWMPGWCYFTLEMAFFPVCIYLPSHLMARKWLPQARAGPAQAPG